MAAVNVLIAFYSRNGNTEALAKAVAEGARSEGAEVKLRRVNDIVSEEIIQKVEGWAASRDRMRQEYDHPTEDDVLAADAIVFGTPTRYGNVSAELKAWIDSLGGLWAQGKLVGKVGSAFTSTSTIHGGQETTIVTLYIPMAHFGMVIVPPGYASPAVFQAGSPYGATSVSGGNSDQCPTETDLEVARFQGALTAQVARALKAAKATPA